MFDFNQYKEALLNDDEEFGIFSHYHLTDYAETCEWECKRKFSQFRQWEKQNEDILDFYYIYGEEFTNAKIAVKEILEDNSYKYGWYLYLKNTPADKIEMISVDKFSKLPNFTETNRRFETLKNQIILSVKTKDDKKLIEMYFKFRKDYEMLLLQLLTNLGYNHCQLTKNDEKNIEEFFQEF